MVNTTDAPPIYEQPSELLRNLLRFDTTKLVGRVDNRPNLIARLKGRGDAPDLWAINK